MNIFILNLLTREMQNEEEWKEVGEERKNYKSATFLTHKYVRIFW